MQTKLGRNLLVADMIFLDHSEPEDDQCLIELLFQIVGWQELKNLGRSRLRLQKIDTHNPNHNVNEVLERNLYELGFQCRIHKNELGNPKDLSFSSVSLDNSDCQLVILDTLVPRELLSSSYNNRYEEMLEVAEAIGLTRVDSLAGVDRVPQNLRPKLKARLRHVLTECERVKRAAKAIEMREWRVLGFLMNQSHASLRDDYEVSCPELDTIVSLAQAQKGVLGARLTGGGFGGCAIALCRKNSAQSWQKGVAEAYNEIFGYNPNIFEANFSQGVKLTLLSSASD